MEKAREGGVVTLPSAYMDVHCRRAVDGGVAWEERAGLAIIEIVVMPPGIGVSLCLFWFK